MHIVFYSVRYTFTCTVNEQVWHFWNNVHHWPPRIQIKKKHFEFVLLEYFAMIQSETGRSDVHFEKGGGLLGREESKIKGLASEAADGVSRQLAASDCSIGPCGSSIEGNFDMYMTILQEVINIYDRKKPSRFESTYQGRR